MKLILQLQSFLSKLFSFFSRLQNCPFRVNSLLDQLSVQVNTTDSQGVLIQHLVCRFQVLPPIFYLTLLLQVQSLQHILPMPINVVASETMPREVAHYRHHRIIQNVDHCFVLAGLVGWLAQRADFWASYPQRDEAHEDCTAHCERSIEEAATLYIRLLELSNRSEWIEVKLWEFLSY